MIKATLPLLLVFLFDACSTSNREAPKEHITEVTYYTPLSDTIRAREIIDVSYDDLVSFMSERNMNVNEYFLEKGTIQVSSDYLNILVPVVGIDDFPKGVQHEFEQSKKVNSPSGYFVIDSETDKVLEFIEGNIGD